jgi:hypothetical protein
MQIIMILAEERPMTVRQIFYQLVGRGWIDKTENEYKNTVVRLLGDMRRAGELPFDWIADNTRWQRKPQTHASLQDCLDETAKFYRRSLWLDQPSYVEIWLEKEALAGVVLEVTDRWDVPLMVTRGYPSISFLHTAGEFIADIEKPTFLYYFGDLDPSGLDISRKVKEDIVEFSNGANVTFERVAITEEQVKRLKLPTRPTKKTDTRSRNFRGESVEVDAIPPNELRRMVDHCITRHIDQRVYDTTIKIEAEEREALAELVHLK